MNEEVRQEYLNLREEIQTNLGAQRNISTFSITTVITIIGIAVSMESPPPEFYLIPYILLLLSAAKVRNLRNNITLIVGYMIVRIENTDSFFWETCLNEMRKRKRTYLDQNNEEDAGNKFSLIVNHFGEHLETQEFTFMAVICLGLFCYNAFMKSTYEMSAFVIAWRIVAVAICLLCITLIYKWSSDYWNMDDRAILDNKNKWANVIEGMRGGEQESTLQ